MPVATLRRPSRTPQGPGTVRVAVVPIGCGRQDGVLIAGSQRPAFPSEDDRLLLSVAANQAAAVLQQQRTEEAVRASRRFRPVDHAPIRFFVQDDRNVVLDVNRQACESLGYTRDELLGMTPLDFDLDVTPAERRGNQAASSTRER